MPPKNDQSRTCRRSQRLSGKVEVVDERRPQTRARRAKVEECSKPTPEPTPSPSPAPSPVPSTHSPTPPLASRLRRSTRVGAATSPPKPPVKKVSKAPEAEPSPSKAGTRSTRQSTRGKIEPVPLREPTPPTKKILTPPVEDEPQPSVSFVAPVEDEQQPSAALNDAVEDDPESLESDDELIIEAAEEEPQPSTSSIVQVEDDPGLSVSSIAPVPLLTPPETPVQAETSSTTDISLPAVKTKTVQVRLPILPVFEPIPSFVSRAEKSAIMQKRQRILKAYQEKQMEAFLKAGIALKPKHVPTPDKTPSKKPVRRRRSRRCSKHRIRTTVKVDPRDGLLTIRNGRVLKRSTRRILEAKVRAAKARIIYAQCGYEKIKLPKKERVLSSKFIKRPLTAKASIKKTGSVKVVEPKPKIVAKKAEHNTKGSKRVSWASVKSASNLKTSLLKPLPWPVLKNAPEAVITPKKRVAFKKPLEIVQGKPSTKKAVTFSPYSVINELPVKTTTPTSRFSKQKSFDKLAVKQKSILKRTSVLKSILKRAATLKSVLKQGPVMKSVLKPTRPGPLPFLINGYTLRPRQCRKSKLPKKSGIISSVRFVRSARLKSPAKATKFDTVLPAKLPKPLSNIFRSGATLGTKPASSRKAQLTPPAPPPAKSAKLDSSCHFVATPNAKHATVDSKSTNSEKFILPAKPKEPSMSFTVPVPKSNANSTKQKVRLTVKGMSGKIVDTVVDLSKDGKATNSVDVLIGSTKISRLNKSTKVPQKTRVKFADGSLTKLADGIRSGKTVKYTVRTEKVNDRKKSLLVKSATTTETAKTSSNPLPRKASPRKAAKPLVGTIATPSKIEPTLRSNAVSKRRKSVTWGADTSHKFSTKAVTFADGSKEPALAPAIKPSTPVLTKRLPSLSHKDGTVKPANVIKVPAKVSKPVTITSKKVVQLAALPKKLPKPTVKVLPVATQAIPGASKTVTIPTKSGFRSKSAEKTSSVTPSTRTSTKTSPRRSITFAKEPFIKLFDTKNTPRSISADTKRASSNRPTSSILKTAKPVTESHRKAKSSHSKSAVVNVKPRSKSAEACSGKRTIAAQRTAKSIAESRRKTETVNARSVKPTEIVTKQRSHSDNATKTSSKKPVSDTLTVAEAAIVVSMNLPTPVKATPIKPTGVSATLGSKLANSAKPLPARVETPRTLEATPVKSAKRRLSFPQPAELPVTTEVDVEHVRPVRSAKAVALTKVCTNIVNANTLLTPVPEKPLTNGKVVAEKPSVSLTKELESLAIATSVKIEKSKGLPAKPVLTNGKTPLPDIKIIDERLLEVANVVIPISPVMAPLTNGIRKLSIGSPMKPLDEEVLKPPPTKRLRVATPPQKESTPVKEEEQTPPMRTSMRSAKFKALEALHATPKSAKTPVKASAKPTVTEVKVESTPALKPSLPVEPSLTVSAKVQSSEKPAEPLSAMKPPPVAPERKSPTPPIDIPRPPEPLPPVTLPKKFLPTVASTPLAGTLKRKAEPFPEPAPFFTPITIHTPRSIKRRATSNVDLPSAVVPKPPPQKRQKRETIVPTRVRKIKRRPAPIKRTKYQKRIVLFHSKKQQSLNVLRMPANFNPLEFLYLEDFFLAGMVGKPKKRPPIPASELLDLEDDDEESESVEEEEEDKENQVEETPPARNLRSRKNASEQPLAAEKPEPIPMETEKGSEAEPKEEGNPKKKCQLRKRHYTNVREGPEKDRTPADEMKIEYLKQMDELLRAEPPKFKQHGARKLGRALPVTFKKLIAIAHEYHKWNPSEITLAVQDMKTSKFTGMVLLPKFRIKRSMRSVPKDRVRKLLPILRRDLVKMEATIEKPKVEETKKTKTTPKKTKVVPKKSKQTPKKTQASLKTTKATPKKTKEPTPVKRILTRVTRQRPAVQQPAEKKAVKKPTPKKIVQKPAKKLVVQTRATTKVVQKPTKARAVQKSVKKKVVKKTMKAKSPPRRRTTRSMAKLATIKKKKHLTKKPKSTKKAPKPPPKMKKPKKKKKLQKVKMTFRKWPKNSPCPQLKIELLTNLKWLALLTPCQAKCSCQAFKTKRVKWSLKTRRRDVQKLQVTSHCDCSHPLWMHRRKYKTAQRKKRVQLMEDIGTLQKVLRRETNPEKCRVYFLLWKDLVRAIQFNLPLPKDQVRYARLMQNPTSIRRMFNVFVNHNHACPDYFSDQHCLDLITTVNDFKLPPPNKTWLLHYSFLRRDYEGTVVEDSFQGIYRNYYSLWFTFCYIARVLKTVPTLNLIDIVGPHVFQMFYESVGLRLEERLVRNSDAYVATVSALYRRFIEYVEVNFFNADDVPSLEGYCERSGPPEGLNLLKSDYRLLQIPLEGERVPAAEALDLPTGCLALDRSLRVQFLEKALEPFTVKREIVQFFAVEVLKSMFKKNQKYIFQRAVQMVNHAWKDGTAMTTLRNMQNVCAQMRQQQWLTHFDTETEKNFASGGLVLMVVDGKTSYDRPVMSDLLTQFAAVIHTQLPKMPRHYILRLLLNSKHKCMILVKYNDENNPCKLFWYSSFTDSNLETLVRTWRVVGGICFRTFPTQEFSEIVFVTISTENQVHGYGTFLMNELKRYHVEHLGYQHLLTYADNNAFGYFKKQHFSTDVPIPEVQYNNFIKCYDGAKLMYCQAKMCNNREEEDNALEFMLDKLDQFESLVVKNRKMKFTAFDIFKQQGIEHRPIDELFPDSVLDVPKNHSNLLRTLVALCGRKPKPPGGLSIEKRSVPTIVPQPRRKPTGIDTPLNYLKVKMSKGKPKSRIAYQFAGLDEHPEDRVDDELEIFRETPLEMYLEKQHPDAMKTDLLGLPMAFTSSEPEPVAVRNSPYKMTVHLYQKTKLLHTAMMRFLLSWPFHYPVDSYDAPTYAESVYMPMTLEIIGNRLRNMYYKTIEMVFADFNRIFTNCYSFNEQLDGHYYHCCYRCHQYFNAFTSRVFSEYDILDFLMPIPELKTTFPQHNRKKAKVAFDSLRPYWYPEVPDSDENDSTDENETDSEDEYGSLMAAIKRIQKEEAKRDAPVKPKPVLKPSPKKGRPASKPKGRPPKKAKGRPAKGKKSAPKPKSPTKSKPPAKPRARAAKLATADDSGPCTRTRAQKQAEPTSPRVLRTRGTVNQSPARPQRSPTKKVPPPEASPPKSPPAHHTPVPPVRARRNAAAVATLLICKTTPKTLKPTSKPVPPEKPAEKPSKEVSAEPATTGTPKTKTVEKDTLPKPSPRSPPKKWVQTKLNFAPVQRPQRTSKKAAPPKLAEKPKERSKSPEPSPPRTRTAIRAALQKSAVASPEPEVPSETPKKGGKRKPAEVAKEVTPSPEPEPSPPQTRTTRAAAAKAKSTPSVDTEEAVEEPETVKSPEPPQIRTTRAAAKSQSKAASVLTEAQMSPGPILPPVQTKTTRQAAKSESKQPEAPKEKSPSLEPDPSPPLTRTARRAAESKSTPSESEPPVEQAAPKSPEPVPSPLHTRITRIAKSQSTAIPEESTPSESAPIEEEPKSLEPTPSPPHARITRRAAHAMEKEKTPEAVQLKPEPVTPKKAFKRKAPVSEVVEPEVKHPDQSEPAEEPSELATTAEPEPQPGPSKKAKVARRRRPVQKKQKPRSIEPLQVKKELVSPQIASEAAKEPPTLPEPAPSPPRPRITRRAAHAMAEEAKEKTPELLQPKPEPVTPQKPIGTRRKAPAKPAEKTKSPEVIELSPEPETPKLTRSRVRQQQEATPSESGQEETPTIRLTRAAARATVSQTPQRRASDAKASSAAPSTRRPSIATPKSPEPSQPELRQVKEEPRTPSPRHTRATTRAATKASANLPSPRRRGRKR
uniref:Bromo domain-containing protein n=1 Tax=Panagrellus redivivus TaxID=6233 RepID=A0A7E4V5D5_PANRE